MSHDDLKRQERGSGYFVLICCDRGACLERRQIAGARSARAMRAAGANEMPGFEVRR